MQKSKNILIAPLNWGLGHATRCIPIINAIINNGDHPIIASDGEALELLKKEYSKQTFIELPSYDIEYAKEGQNLRLKMLKDSPKIWMAIRNEQQMLQEIIPKYTISGIISDNRLGLYSNLVPSVIITHQLQVLSGSTTWLSTQLHLHYIKKYDYCWIPDFDSPNNLTGKLSYNEDFEIEKVFLGPLSRFQNTGNYQKKYDLMVLLSGPEPQRGILEKKLLTELKSYKGKVLFIAGKVEKEQKVEKKGRLTYYNYLSTDGLQKALDRSEMVLSRSGYTTIMDLQKMGKKAFFIPTPGQFEQEYLAELLDQKGIVPYATQEDFQIQMLSRVELYKGWECSQPSSSSPSSILKGTFSNVNENSEPMPSSLST
ncbi:glycosyltransferase [Nonlabens sp.]|uniref:glycosyltransferase n=1 Tax=Nonlabens sp. TaxID=1888209 RepID=UPI001BCDBFF0|nr:glycosyltransferase [Nonlabens sp.]